MSRATPVCVLIVVLSGVGALDGAPLNRGNLVVLQVGDGTVLTGTHPGDVACPVMLKEFTLTPDSLPVQVLALPTIAAGLHRKLTINRNGYLQGMLRRSSNAHYLFMAGYDAAIGTPAPYAALASNINRVVGRVDALGNIDTTTALTDAYSGDAYGGIWNAISDDGTRIWTAGQSKNVGYDATSSIRYTTLGSTTSTRLSSRSGSPDTLDYRDPRVVGIFDLDGSFPLTTSDSHLFTVWNYAGRRGVYVVDEGLPTVAEATITWMRNITINANQNNPCDFWFADSSTAYMCVDLPIFDRGGGLNKYKLEWDEVNVRYRWNFKGVFQQGLPLSCGVKDAYTVRSLTGRINGNGQVELFVITAESDTAGMSTPSGPSPVTPSPETGCPNRLMMLTDTGCAKGNEPGCDGRRDTFVTLQTAPANTVFRGVQWAPRSCEGPECPGACCMMGNSCSGTTQAACAGTWLGPDSTCENSTCSLSLFCHDPSGDSDGDGDVDMDDFGRFQACYTGPGGETPGALPDECVCFDRPFPNGDGDVDLDDFGVFAGCADGPGIAALAACDD